MYLSAKKYYNFTGIKLKTPQLIFRNKRAIESAWNQFFPEYAYTATFMDESINDFYRAGKPVIAYYIKFLQALLFSFLALAYMVLFRLWPYSVRKK